MRLQVFVQTDPATRDGRKVVEEIPIHSTQYSVVFKVMFFMCHVLFGENDKLNQKDVPP